MSDVQRFGPCDGDCVDEAHPCDELHFVRRDDGPWVEYDAHQAAVVEAVQRQREDDNRALWDDRQHDEGWNDALDAVLNAAAQAAANTAGARSWSLGKAIADLRKGGQR